MRRRDYTLIILLFVALFSDFLANNRPLICSIEGETYFPVWRQVWRKALHIPRKSTDVLDSLEMEETWKTADYEWVIFPPIQYHSMYRDLENRKISPFQGQKIDTWRNRHWLGTDPEGRDVLAGLISGTRIAFLVCLIVLGIAGLLGVLLGLLAGFYRDSHGRVSRRVFFLGCFGFVVGSFGAWSAFPAMHYHHGLAAAWVSSVVLLIVVSLIFSGIGWLMSRFFSDKKISLPLDSLLLRLIELIESLPGLMLIMAIMVIPEKTPSFWMLMVWIGLFSWPRIALFVRAEMLRIRELPYMEAASLSGLSTWRILFRHALPNALPPALVAISMSLGGAILFEASLSYLGISGMTDQMSWGRLLFGAKNNPTAWWLTLFPGALIFICVRYFYTLAYQKGS